MEKKTIILTAIICFIAAANIASATNVRGIEMDFVTIGNPGNPGDTRTDYPLSARPYDCGAVDYTYQIGKYEITNGQWDAFVSASGAPTGNPSDAYDENTTWTGDNIPTNEVSWYEATQFCNYLTSGNKSLGAYLFSGNDSNAGNFLSIDRGGAVSTYGIVYVMPTEDEWYKAAYYTGSGYSSYADGTDVIPAAGVGTNWKDAIGHPWDVGTGTMEQNGTFDMMGNVWEWTETLAGSRFRSVRGGTFNSYRKPITSDYAPSDPYLEEEAMGFRIAVIPEPATFLLLGLGVPILSGLRRKR